MVKANTAPASISLFLRKCSGESRRGARSHSPAANDTRPNLYPFNADIVPSPEYIKVVDHTSRRHAYASGIVSTGRITVDAPGLSYVIGISILSLTRAGLPASAVAPVPGLTLAVMSLEGGAGRERIKIPPHNKRVKTTPAIKPGR